MEIRSQFFPRRPVDVGAFIFVVTMIPLVYWFEIFVVLPYFYPVGTFWYVVHFLCAHFLMINVTSSFVNVVLIDTSVNCNKNYNLDDSWSFCSQCAIQVPPRAWHCQICGTCILKRDHHCLFVGYCIGYHNHRYFLMFLFYMLLSTVYATYFNFFFLTVQLSYKQLLLRSVFALPLLLHNPESQIQIYILIFFIIIGGFVMVSALFSYHCTLFLCGSVGYEKRHSICDYNEGLKNNIINVFGDRWYVAWLSPFIFSKLPGDGFFWERKLSYESKEK